MFPGGVTSGICTHFSQISTCFSVVYHQFAKVPSKNGELCTAGPPRSKIGQICQKIFFENFAHFLQNNETTHILMLGLILGIFAKMTNFSRGGYVVKLDPFFTNFDLFFCCLSSIYGGNEQKWGIVYTRSAEGKNCPNLPETFFREFCTIFAK